MQNYRGISILSTIPKILEGILTDEIFNTFKNYIIPEQHGFCRGRSTTTNLAVYQAHLVSSVEAGQQVDAIYTDLSKAFDSVCHPLLFKKLFEIGITGTYLEWIISYLTDRRQLVSIGGTSSNEVHVTSGVPQGSHIGPVLFNLFINDVASCFKSSNYLLYADDLKFFSVVTPGHRKLQTDLDALSNWCDANLLKLNVNKCKSMSFYKCTNPIRTTYRITASEIEHVTSYDDLGVTFDEHLSFTSHIEKIVQRSFRMLGFIRRNTSHIYDTKSLMVLYNSLVRSILEYCSVVWSPFYACHKIRIEQVQNKFAKYMLLKLHYPYKDVIYDTRLLLCGLKSLEQRRSDAQLLFLFKLIHGDINCSSLLAEIYMACPVRRTRHVRLFYERRHRTNYGMTALTDRLLVNYNRHFSNIDIFNISLVALKRTLKFGVA